MASEADGTPGNRPASTPEIRKLPRVTCGRCGFQGVWSMLALTDEGYRCVNVKACIKRQALLGARA